MTPKKALLLLSLLYFYDTAHAEQRVKLYTFYTPSHAVLFNDWFLPSVSKLNEYDLVVEKYGQECESAEFMGEGWKKTTRRKITLMIRAIKENWGSFFVYSDVDIQFFRLTLPEIRKALMNTDIVFQQDDHNKNACTGFFACKANSRTLIFWETVGKVMDIHAKHSDQASVITLLKLNKHRFAGFSWGLLPITFFGGGVLTGEMWNPGDDLVVPEEIILHHANYTVGVANKIEQLNYVRSVVTESRS
jgi:hypothetical protein